MIQFFTYVFDGSAALGLAAAGSVALVGGGVALYERFSAASRLLLAFTGILAAGLFLFALTDAAPDAAAAAGWFHAGLAVHALLPPALYSLALHLARVPRPKPLRTAWVAGIGLALWTLMSNAVPHGVAALYGPGDALTPVAWPAFLYAGFMATLIAAALAEMVRGYRRSTRADDRHRLLAVAAAFSVGALGLLDFVAATRSLGVSIAPFAAIGTSLLLGYAATRLRAFAPLPAFATERILQVMGDGVLLCDAEGRVRNANRAAVELLGRPEERLTDISVGRIVRTADDGQGFAPCPRNAIRDREMRIVRPDGETIEVSLSSEPLFEGEELIGSVVVFRDIRERLRAARALRATEHRYRSLFWNNPIMAYEVDLDGRVLHANAAVERLLGLPTQELQGQPFSDFIDPGDMELAMTQFASSLQGQAQEYHFRVVLPHGGSAEIRGASIPVVRDGQVVGVFGVGLDVTEEQRIRRELELQRLEFAQLFEASPEAIAVADEDDILVRVNPEFTRTFGYEPEEALGRKINDLLVPPELKDEGRELSKGVRAGEVIRMETVRRRKDGSRVDVSVLARELSLPGRPTLIYGIYRDITHRKRTEQALKEREEELRHAQRIEAVGKLAGGVAHDFNNLVTVINGHISFALESLPTEHVVRRDLEEVERAGRRAANLTQQLLAFSRRQVLRPETVNAAAVIRDVRQMLGRLIGEHIRFETAHKGDARVRVDRGQLEQVLVNLVVNARDAMPQGGRLTIATSRVHLSDHDTEPTDWEITPGDYVRIAVEDNGIGMDEETRARAFDPFFTTKERGKGTGLGLATAFGIVKQSGGHLIADSKPGRGTTITAWLPAAVTDGADTVSSPALAPREPIAGSAAVGRILVVEDEKALRELAARVLRRAGHEVLLAEDGMQGLDIARTDPVDLVVSDLVMPRMGGREMARQLRLSHPTLPILFISGYDDEIDPHLDGDSLLPKPFTPADLAARVSHALGLPHDA